MSGKIEYTGPHYFNIGREIEALDKDKVFVQTHTLSSCWGFGPLEVCVTYSSGGIDYEVKLLGQRIGGGRLDQNNADITIGVDIGLAKVSIQLKADFAKKELTVHGEACVRNWHGGWDCSPFDAVILRW